MGRHVKLTQELQDMADAYVDGGYLECEDVVPSRAGLAVELGVCRQTIKNWETIPAFLGTLSKLDATQERKLASGGLSNAMNSTIVKLMLANHGYSDRNVTDHQSSDGSMSPKGKSLDDFYSDSDVPPKS